MANSNLYPPIMDTYLSANIQDSTKKSIININFSLSDYNKIDDIKGLHLIFNNQQTSRSVFSESEYPLGIKEYSMAKSLNNKEIEKDSSTGKQFIKLNTNELNLTAGTIYKIQIRFTSATTIDDGGSFNASWINNNLECFSEWSSVGLMKIIPQPKLSFTTFLEPDQNETLTQEVYHISTDLLSLIGTLSCEDKTQIDNADYLKSYSADIYKINISKNTEELYESSGTINTETQNPDEINYNFKNQLIDNQLYRLDFTYLTNSLYSNTISYYFRCVLEEVPIKSFNMGVFIKENVEEENIEIAISLKDFINYTFDREFIITRASDKDNFLKWETINTISLPINHTYIYYRFADMTAESGVYQKQAARLRYKREDEVWVYSKLYQSSTPIMLLLDHMYLIGDYKYLRLKFDPQISSFKYNVKDSIIETLGSKYPFVRRNAKTNYRSFSIGGLISYHMDENGTFAKKKDLYNNQTALYKSFNKENKITEYNDYILERKFREAVMDFLYDDSIKLFRSTTEGNILIKLTDISLTPNDVLGRMIYSFSATATEVAEDSIDNYTKQDIQRVEVNEELYTTSTISVLDTIEFNDDEEIVYIDSSNISLTNIVNSESPYYDLILQRMTLIEVDRGDEEDE